MLDVAEGLIADTDDGPRLVGSECPSCRTRFFPAATTCRNPACSGAAAAPVYLGPEGTVFSYTVLHYPPPAQYSPPQTPYAVALVDLPGDVRVAGIVRGDPDDVHIDDPVRLVVDVVRSDADGTPRRTWMFEPTQGTRA